MENTQKQIQELEMSFTELERKIEEVQKQLQEVQGKMEYFDLMFDSILDLGILASKTGGDNV